MATNLIVITDALRDIGVINEVETPSAEQGSHALRQLNNLMSQWLEDDCDLGYFTQTSTADTCPIPPWAEGGVKAGLALFLAPTYGKSVSAEFVAKAESLISTVQRKCLVEKMRAANMDFMPMGEGNRYRGRSILTDS